MAQGKRKRQDRQYSQDEGQGRPSPHRPETMNLAQQAQRNDNRGSGGNGNGNGGRRRSRGGGQPNYNPHDTQRNGSQVNAAGSPSRPSQNTMRPPGPAQGDTPIRDMRQSQTPVVQTAPTPVRDPSPPRGQSVPFAYDYVTDDIVGAWQETGRHTLKEILVKNEISAAVAIQELVRSAIDRRLDPQEAGSLFHDAMQSSSSAADLQDLLVDTAQLTDPSDWQRSSFSAFLLASGIPADVWRKTLDEDVLKEVGLVRKHQGAAFSQIKARKITNLLYRQQNYNLLREETEGYAKLITEYFNTAMNASGAESPPTIAEDAFQRVRALVGSFDLDVGRVLDITLDVFANLLVRNFRFFVKFIRASSWWPEDSIPDIVQWKGQGFDSLPEWALPGSKDWGMGPEEADRAARLEPLKLARDIEFWQRVKDVGIDAFSEIGNRQITNFDSVSDFLSTEVEPEYGAGRKEMNAIKRIRINDARKWMRETQTLPPTGNADAAQLLGFKLAFYASPARDKDDIMPENLIFLAALLIKIGFISLRDLYPHLHPPDDKMDEVKAKLEEEARERERANRPGGAARNALATAGALADDMPPAVKVLKDFPSGSPRPDGTPTPSKPIEDEKLPDPPDQKILLLKSLLAIGALPEAIFILGKFPWLSDLVPEVPEHIHRILHHMLNKVCESLRPLSDCPDISEQASQLGDPAGLPKGLLNMTRAPARIVKRWANIDRPDIGEGAAFKFYWDSWSDNVPLCQNVDDVFLLCNTFLNFSGVKIGRDSLLLSKLVRIGKHSLQEDRSSGNESRWIELLKRLLVPALSMTKKNPGLVLEVFDLLKLFPTSTRYSIYAEWHFGPTCRQPAIKNAFSRTEAEAKDVLKRISKTNVRAMGKALAKVAYASPGVVLRTAIYQMESYENLIEVFVECSRYFTLLGYDVLVWCLLNALGDTNRSRIQPDGMLTSGWLRALSNFAGAIFKRYQMCNPSPILQYVANELRNGRSTDLELLEQIITAMTGIKSDMTFNDTQVLAMAGGEVLQAQTIITLADERHKNEKSSRRLIRSLTESGLAGQLLISIAQEQQMYAYHDSSQNAPLKVLGNNVDKINQVFVQYLDTLCSNLSAQDFGAAIPDVVSLIRDFGLEPATAFMIGRRSITHAVAEFDAARKQEQQDKSRRMSLDKPQINGDMKMDDAEDTQSMKIESIEASQEAENGITKSLPTGTEEEKDINVKTNGTPAPTVTVTTSAVDDTQEAFWHPALTTLVESMPSVLDDAIQSTISIPFYVTFWTLGLQDIVVNTASYDQELAKQTQLIKEIKNDRSDVTSAAARDRDRKIKIISELKERLAREMKAQIGAYTQIRNRLSKEKDHWFQDFHNMVAVLHTSILQNCFLPRIFLSPLDAHYTFMMLKFLHNNGTPGFRTMHLIDHLIKKNQMFAIMFQCTARESENFGRFLNELLKELQSWHADKTTYEKTAFGAKKQLPGFARQMNPDRTPDLLLEYEDFRRLLYKWHINLNHSFKNAFESGEYMHIRNAIIILKCVHQHFPAVNWMGQDMITRVEKIGQDDPRADLKLAATSLMGNLKPREKSWMMPQAFRINEGAANGPKSGPSQPATPQPPRSVTPALNATAPEFKPDDGDVPKSAISADDEDGEIRDERKPEIDGQSSQTSAAIDKQSITAKTTTPFAPKEILKRPQSHDSRSASSVQNPTASSNSSTSNDRDSSMQAGIQPAHTLPPRPELRSSARQPSSSNRPNNSPYPRPDQRDREDYGRLDRPSDVGRVSALRGVSPSGPTRPRSSEREVTRLRDERDYPVLDSHSDRDYRSRDVDHRTVARPRVHDEPRARDEGRGTPQSRPIRSGKSSVATPSHDLASNQVAAQASRENPERTALIEQENQSRESSRASRDGKRDRPSRAPSPRRDDRQVPPTIPESRRNERGIGAPMHPPTTAAPRHDPISDRAPTGPRHDPYRDTAPRRSSHDVFEGAQPPRGPSDPSHGRLDRQYEPSYGRLKAPDAPSGPRAAPSYPTRNPSSSNNFGNQATSPNLPTMSPRTQTSSSGSARPSEESAVAGVHPSRLSQLPLDTIQPPATPNMSSPRSSQVPPVGTPTGPAPAARGTPSGPSSATSRSDKRFAGLNTALQGGPERGPSIRGRAGRATGPMMSPSGSTPLHQQGPTQTPRAQEPFTAPLPQGPRNGQAANSPITPVDSSAFPPRQENSHRSSGRSDEHGHRDRHHHERASKDSRPQENRHGYGPEAPNGRRDDYRDRREGDERSRHGPEDATSRYRNATSAGGYPDQRDFGSGPNPYSGGGRDYPKDLQAAPRTNVDQPLEYRGNDGRGSARHRGGPRDEGPAGWDDPHGDRARDARKRHGDDMNPGDSKRRRSGR